MTKLSWDSRTYESGLDRGVLYLEDNSGIAWNGLMAVNESNDGFELSSNYIDGYKYAIHQTQGNFAATLQAFTYPDEFEEYDGHSEFVYTNQKRKKFNFSYRTKIKEDSYKIHLVYGALTEPSERANTTLGSDMAPAVFSWALVADAHYVIDSTVAYPETLAEIESMLYGSEVENSSLPDIDTIVEIFESEVDLRITDNGDGTWTAEGDSVTMLDATTFQIDSPSVIFLTSDTYRVSSY